MKKFWNDYILSVVYVEYKKPFSNRSTTLNWPDRIFLRKYIIVQKRGNLNQGCFKLKIAKYIPRFIFYFPSK